MSRSLVCIFVVVLLLAACSPEEEIPILAETTTRVVAVEPNPSAVPSAVVRRTPATALPEPTLVPSPEPTAAPTALPTATPRPEPTTAPAPEEDLEGTLQSPAPTLQIAPIDRAAAIAMVQASRALYVDPLQAVNELVPYPETVASLETSDVLEPSFVLQLRTEQPSVFSTLVLRAEYLDVEEVGEFYEAELDNAGARFNTPNVLGDYDSLFIEVKADTLPGFDAWKVLVVREGSGSRVTITSTYPIDDVQATLDRFALWHLPDAPVGSVEQIASVEMWVDHAGNRMQFGTSYELPVPDPAIADTLMAELADAGFVLNEIIPGAYNSEEGPFALSLNVFAGTEPGDTNYRWYRIGGFFDLDE